MQPANHIVDVTSKVEKKVGRLPNTDCPYARMCLVPSSIRRKRSSSRDNNNNNNDDVFSRLHARLGSMGALAGININVTVLAAAY